MSSDHQFSEFLKYVKCSIFHTLILLMLYMGQIQYIQTIGSVHSLELSNVKS